MFCTEMDGIESLSEVVIILASNRADLIDPAVADLRNDVLLERNRVEPARREGEYRLLIRVRAGSPTTSFNIDTQHGYVHVGDPDDPSLSHWFPIFGAIIESVD